MSFANSLGESRDEIISLLRSRGAVSADELAASLGVSKQCIRKHLDVLERGGYVAHAVQRRERGRPANLYQLTAKADELFPRRYDLFAKSLLSQIGAVWGPNGLDRVFCGCANEMIQRFQPSLEGLCFEKRVGRLTEMLNEEGYEAQLEALPDGSYLLTEWNCPTSEVAREYAQLCDRELEVYRTLLAAPVTRESRIVGGASRCAYRVLNPERTDNNG